MIKKFRKELNAGTVSLVILALLDASREPMYGYQIARSLESLDSEDEPTVKQGTLYPVLRSLERNGVLGSSVRPSITGPPRRYYHITEFGRATLRDWISVWRQTRDFVDTILEQAGRMEKGAQDHE